MKKIAVISLLFILLKLNGFAQTGIRADSAKYEYAILQWAKGSLFINYKGRAATPLNISYKTIEGNMPYEDNLQWKIAALEYMDAKNWEFVSASSSLLYFRKKKN